MYAATCFSSATEHAEWVRTKAVSPRELVDHHLARIEAVDPILNAYATVCAERARDAALRAEQRVVAGLPLGPLHGVPYAVKDLLFTAGVRTTGGSRIYADHVPATDAIAVARLERAGAILLGKTNTSEFGFKSTTESALFGSTRNPWHLARTPGGSSGGAAAATAAGLAPLSLGTDAGGSIRTPASFCGIVGFKPTFGLVPHGPGFGGAASLAHTGPLTRTVADAALMLAAIAGPDERDRRAVVTFGGVDPGALGRAGLHGVCVGWSPDLGYAAVDEEVVGTCARALTAFEELGARVEPMAPPFRDPQSAFNTIIRAENHAFAGELLARHGALLEPGMADFTRAGAGISAADYLAADHARASLSLALAATFEHYDLVITPTLATAPFVIDQRPKTIAGRAVAGMDWLAFTYPFNLTGNPAISIPCGFTSEGLPVGLQIVGPRCADLRVLDAAAAFERARPWRAHRPRYAWAQPSDDDRSG